VLIVFIAFVSFKNILGLKTQLQHISKPNEIITSLQVIQKELTQIQSYIRAYSYSNDNTYLIRYEETNASLENNLNKVYLLLSKKHLRKHDSIRRYINYKNRVIAQYIRLQNVDSGQDELDSLMSRFNSLLIQAQQSDSLILVDNDNGRFFQGLISNVFKKRKLKTFDDSVLLTDDSLLDLKETLEKSYNEKNQRLQLKTSIEMELLNQDIEIMDEIRLLISNLLEEENKIFQEKMAQNSKRVESSLWLLGIIIGFSFVLIIVFIIRILNDVKKNEIYQDKLEVAKQKAEELTEAKARFMSSMSHEIRTPLSAILGFSEQLKTNGVNKEEQKKFIDIISRSSKHLLNIVNEILTFSKIDAGKITLEPEEFNYRDLIEEIYQVLAIKAREKELEFSKFTDPSLSNWFIADAQKIKQVIINLTSNAIKFTPGGKVEIYSELITNDKQKLVLKVDVKDTGIGIPKEKLEDIFNEFTQSEKTSSSKYGGTGLGLTISRKMAELMGGTIKVKSIVNEGSTFTVIIPLARAEKKPKTSSTTIQDEILSYTFEEKINVLLVDDDEMNRELGKVILQNMGIEPDLAVDGEDAVHMVKEKQYHLILMDIHMPALNGIEATLKIRELENGDPGKDTSKIIALTANVMKEDVEKFMAVGMNNYLLKPFRQEELYKKMREVLHPDPFKEKGEPLKDDF